MLTGIEAKRFVQKNNALNNGRRLDPVIRARIVAHGDRAAIYRIRRLPVSSHQVAGQEAPDEEYIAGMVEMFRFMNMTGCIYRSLYEDAVFSVPCFKNEQPRTLRRFQWRQVNNRVAMPPGIF